jgi:hypothetical protein
MVGSLRRRTALHPLAAAAEQGHEAAVSRLLELGAPAGHDGSMVAGVGQYTPLMLAAGERAQAVDSGQAACEAGLLEDMSGAMLAVACGSPSRELGACVPELGTSLTTSLPALHL